MADHNPSEHAGTHGVHAQDLKPEHKTTVHKHEASATPAVEQESDLHGAHDKENHSHGKLIPLGKPRGAPESQSSKGGQRPQGKPPTGPKGTKPEAGNQTEHDSESESDKSSGHFNESHGGSEHTTDKRELGKLRGKSAPPTTKGGAAPPGRPKGLKG